MKPLKRTAVLVAMFVLYALLIWSSARAQSITVDEIAHLPAGYSYLVTHDYRLNPQHPPLAKLLCALPLLALHPVLPTADPSWKQADEYRFGYAFMRANAARLPELVAWARLPMALLAALLVLVTGWWAYELYGPAAALLAATLLGATPEVLNHGRWVTTDLPLATFSVLTLYLAWRWFAAPRPGRALAAGLALGSALASKFSAPLLLPLLVLLAIGWRLSGRKSPSWRASLGGLLVFSLGAYAVLALCYQTPLWLPLYWHGFQRIYADHDPLHPFYLLGQLRYEGFPGYFVLAYLIKTPLPILLATALALACLVFKGEPGDRQDALVFLAAAVVVFVAMTLKADDIGLRYVLPASPFLALLIARSTRILGKRGVVLVALLACWAIGDAERAWSDLAGAFDELLPGPKLAYLDDSNLDWGEGLIALRHELRDFGSPRIAYGGVFPYYDPALYGVNATPVSRGLLGRLPAGWYAFSENFLLDNPGFLWLAYWPPLAEVDGIRLYHFPADTGRLALYTYGRLLKGDPSSWLLTQFAALATADGQRKQALDALDLALSDWPPNLVARDARARLLRAKGDVARAQLDERQLQAEEAELRQARHARYARLF